MKKMDGAGLAKMATLEAATVQLQRVHSLVERMAIDVRGQRNTSQARQGIQRAATPLVGLLKPQFGMIADLIASLLLVLTRGGGDQARLRALREYVAQARTSLEISVNRVKDQHLVEQGEGSSEAGEGTR
ncbi:MAG: hypothetical protein ACT4P7_06175 [Gemmatimonadaceae bacterium]